MSARIAIAALVAGLLLVSSVGAPPAPACAPAPPQGKPVVNADQTVILIWDAATETEYFIRKASFKSEAEDFGFIVPTPAEPKLEESGDAAFPYLADQTKPEIKQVPGPSSMACSCGGGPAGKNEGTKTGVKVLAEKEVAGFKASVLEADSANALVKWLESNQFAYSPAIEAWAQPYIEKKWKFTALKVAKSKNDRKEQYVAAKALRMSFNTKVPLFPYQEPNPEHAAKELGAKNRLLRIYFVGEARYRGELTEEIPWDGKVAWSNKLSADVRQKALELLDLATENPGPQEWWLTEFEDEWQYRAAANDVQFFRDPNQDTVKREPMEVWVRTLWPTDVTVYAIAAILVFPPFFRRVRRSSFWRLSRR
jgi:hypothetical protein